VTEDQEPQGFEPVLLEQLAPGDIVLVPLPVEAEVEVVSENRLVVSHGSTARVIYPTSPIWRRVQ
jgi:hypothetical protein